MVVIQGFMVEVRETTKEATLILTKLMAPRITNNQKDEKKEKSL